MQISAIVRAGSLSSDHKHSSGGYEHISYMTYTRR